MSSRTNNKKLTAQKVKNELKQFSSPKRKKSNEWFFKTGKGEYGEGDKFIGVRVPHIRTVAKQYIDLSFSEIKKLLHSAIHEHRLAGLLILVLRYKKSNIKEQKRIVDFYYENIERVNNWDLVDLSASQIVGDYVKKNGGVNKLLDLVRSKNMWKRRVSIVGSGAFIRDGVYEHTLSLSEKLLKDKEDLMHKATGWMLREVGKKDRNVLKKFLTIHSKNMPRTMLRYAIEHFPEIERKKWLKRESNVLKRTK
jgi:3-methyladenine DNA glycosylase AlkD